MAQAERKYQLVSANKVEGTPVYNGQGEHLGEIDDLVIDKYSGQVVYALMSFGGFLGIGERLHPLPWGVLKYDRLREGFVVDIDREALEKAPSYERGELGDMADEAWNRRIYGYYDVPPFWSY